MSDAITAIVPAAIRTASRTPNVPIPARSSDRAAGDALRDPTGAAAAAVDPRTRPAAVARQTNDLRITLHILLQVLSGREITSRR